MVWDKAATPLLVATYHAVVSMPRVYPTGLVVVARVDLPVLVALVVAVRQVLRA